MKRVFTFLLCAVALVLPWRPRVLYANTLAWIAQGVNFIIYSVLRMMMRNLRRKGGER